MLHALIPRPFAGVAAEFAAGTWDRSAADMDAVEVQGGGYFGPDPVVLACVLVEAARWHVMTATV